jgi:hypothetical protein
MNNPDRIVWADIEPRVDIAAVATNLFGPAEGRRGAELLWRCPWHDDQKPSFSVNPAKRRAFCNPCGLSLDAPALVMRVRGFDFLAAVRFLADLIGMTPPSKPRKPPPKAPRDHTDFAREAYRRLWTDEGRDALDYLRGRGLTEDTIRAARLGFVVHAWKWENKCSSLCVPAVTIPWFDRGAVPRVKIRRLDSDDDKCRSLGPSKPPLLFPDVHIAAGSNVIIVEGEFDALLLGQALEGIATVATLGAAQAEPNAAILDRLIAAKAIFAAQDADEAGDKAAAKWTALRRSIIRVRPPVGKDWGDVHARHIDIRRWWIDRLAGDENPPLFTWAELSTWRWGPSKDDRLGGIDFKPPKSIHAEPDRPDDQTPAPLAAIEPSPAQAPSASEPPPPASAPPIAAAGSSRLLPIDACKPLNYCGR